MVLRPFQICRNQYERFDSNSPSTAHCPPPPSQEVSDSLPRGYICISDRLFACSVTGLPNHPDPKELVKCLTSMQPAVTCKHLEEWGGVDSSKVCITPGWPPACWCVCMLFCTMFFCAVLCCLCAKHDGFDRPMIAVFVALESDTSGRREILHREVRDFHLKR